MEKRTTIIDSFDPGSGLQILKINLLENNINVIFFDNDIYGSSIDIPRSENETERELLEVIETTLTKMLKEIQK